LICLGIFWVSAIFGAAWGVLAYLGCSNPTIDDNERDQAERLIQAVEAFRIENDRLPLEHVVPSLKEQLGLTPDETCPCYALRSPDRFIIWYGLTLGESAVYDSCIRAWDDDPKGRKGRKCGSAPGARATVP
jgi:hypothetical protein